MLHKLNFSPGNHGSKKCNWEALVTYLLPQKSEEICSIFVKELKISIRYYHHELVNIWQTHF